MFDVGCGRRQTLDGQCRRGAGCVGGGWNRDGGEEVTSRGEDDSGSLALGGIVIAAAGNGLGFRTPPSPGGLSPKVQDVQRPGWRTGGGRACANRAAVVNGMARLALTGAV